VTAKHLTGFDAPNLQCMYLDKPIADHTLLQAICRTNRPAPNKTHGLIVDYLGIFDDVAKALAFDEKTIQKVITNIDELKDQLGPKMLECLGFFPGVDRTVEGWLGLSAAQQCVPTNEQRDAFALAFRQLTQLWEAISPDPVLSTYEDDYRWLAQVYESLKPPSGNGKLLWHALGAKTIELIHKHVSVQTVRDDLETLVMDVDVLEDLLSGPDAPTPEEVEIRIATRLRRNLNDPRFIALSERLENLRVKHEQGILASVDFLKELLTLARDVVETEREVPVEDQEDRARAALTDLFDDVRTGDTPIIVERVVNDIDEIVRTVRFPGWQTTAQGEREVQKALRRTLLRYKLHNDQDLFDRAYGYIVQYY
jgi:type I restriction enzyme, R subunit